MNQLRFGELVKFNVPGGTPQNYRNFVAAPSNYLHLSMKVFDSVNGKEMGPFFAENALWVASDHEWQIIKHGASVAKELNPGLTKEEAISISGSLYLNETDLEYVTANEEWQLKPSEQWSRRKDTARVIDFTV